MLHNKRTVPHQTVSLVEKFNGFIAIECAVKLLRLSVDVINDSKGECFDLKLLMDGYQMF